MRHFTQMKTLSVYICEHPCPHRAKLGFNQRVKQCFQIGVCRVLALRCGMMGASR